MLVFQQLFTFLKCALPPLTPSYSAFKRGIFRLCNLGLVYFREPLLKGKAYYSWPPCTKNFRSAHLYIENILYHCYKTSYPNQEVSCSEPSSPLVSFPCSLIHCWHWYVIWNRLVHFGTETTFYHLAKRTSLLHSCLHECNFRSCKCLVCTFFIIFGLNLSRLKSIYTSDFAMQFYIAFLSFLVPCHCI